MQKDLLPYNNFHTLIFDFDGVFTDNNVLINQDGIETVKCNRGDGLGLDILKKFIDKKNWELDYFILSTEKNPVVLSRANKLKIKCEYGIENKLKFIKDYLKRKFPLESNKEQGIIYLGNDLNDFAAMRFVGTSIAPSDAHYLIKEEASIVLESKGGQGFVREFIEKLISCNNLENNTLMELL